jgi:plasmid stabilization system protein ParE
VKHVVRPNAKGDILRQFRYYLLKDALDAANSFLDAVDESIGALCRMPDIGAPSLSKNPVLVESRCRMRRYLCCCLWR